jgi:hypothetical protein
MEGIILDTIPRAVEIVGTDDIICPICLRALHHKSIEEGVPEVLYCDYDGYYFQPEFPYQMLGVMR